MIEIFLGTLAITILAIVIFLFSGYFFYSLLFKNNPSSLKIGISYFLGVSLFFVIYRILDYIISNARVSMIISLAILLILGLVNLRKNPIDLRNKLNYKTLIVILILLIFSFLFVLFLWLEPLKTHVINDFMRFNGSLHSGRYANIATYIFENNKIPVLNQNYGQSLLATISMFLGFNNPFLALYIWLSFSIFFLIITIYGFFRYFGINKTYSSFFTLIVMFGGTALSLAYIGLIDSGSPFIAIGHSDTLISFATFLIFIIFIKNIIKKENNSFLVSAVLLFILIISWCIYAPQNIIIAFPLMFLLFLLFSYQDKKINKKLLFLMILLLVFLGIGILLGGMLTPQFLVNKNADIPGTMTIIKEGAKNIELAPVLPYVYPTINESSHSVYFYSDLREIRSKGLNININSIPGILFLLEAMLWDSLRIIFFPFISFVFLFFYLFYYNKENNRENIKENNKDIENIKFLYIASIITFLIGFFIAYFFIIQGRKWELSRFLIPGYGLGLICLGISLNFLKKLIKNKILLISIFFIILLFLFFGNFYHILLIIYSNISASGEYVSFFERIRMMIATSGIIR